MSSDSPATPPEDKTKQFMALFSRHERRIKCYILALLPNWQEAEEVFGETNLRLWQQFDEFDAGKDFGGWACTIAYYQVLTFRKRQSRSRQVLSGEVIEYLAQESADRSELEDRRYTALAHCLEKVSSASRQLMQRCYSGGKSIKEVAADMNRTASSVYSSLARIRFQLHSCIRARLADEDDS